MLGREPVLSKDGKRLVDAHGRGSYVTSAGAGPSIGKHILLSYLPPENANVGEELLVEFLGEQYPVTVQTNDATPVFDPDNARIRASEVAVPA
jgi:glycine cleavage system aminomethyltransferase T